jgi:DNA-directed RNA polymerase specialized sigma24 family protein
VTLRLAVSNVPRLTREQRELVRTVPGLAEDVANDFRRTLGTVLSFDDALSLAHLGIAEAAASFESERGVPFRYWGRLGATRSIRDEARREQRHVRLRRACRAATFVLAVEQATPSPFDDPFHGDDDATQAALSDALDDLTLAMVVASQPDGSNPEDELIERETWQRVRAALGKVLGDLDHERAEMLVLHAHDYDIKRIALERGVNYFGLLETFHATIKLVRARLRAMGILGSPDPRDDEPWNLLARLRGQR